MASTRVKDIFLSGSQLPPNVEPTADLAFALDGAEIVVGVMPSRFVRRLYGAMLLHLNSNMRFFSATKGLENGTLLRRSEESSDGIGKSFQPRIAVQSGR